MKLSKVKKVCMDASEIIVKRADTGIDVRTWIGTQSALYPVRGLDMSAELAIRIWEIEQKKLRSMEINQDTDEEEAATRITREDLEKISFMGDTFADAYDEETPGLAKIATIDNWIILEDRNTGKAWAMRADKLEPVEGTRLLFVQTEGYGNLIAIYADGILEAAVYAMPWERNDYLKSVIHEIAKIDRAEGE